MSIESCSKHFASVCLVIALSICSSGVALCGSDGNSVDSVRSENAVYVKGITPGRARSLLGVAPGVISIGIGWRAKKLAANNRNGARPWSIAALSLGTVAIVLSVVHLISTSGGFGTGGGKAGALVAFSSGIIGAILGAPGMRSRTK